MKVYASIVQTDWECGDEKDHSESLIAICSDPDKAYNAGWEIIHRDFEYDKEFNLYYGSMADEVWLTVLEFELDDTSFESGHLMIKDENGIWHNTYEENQKGMMNYD